MVRLAAALLATTACFVWLSCSSEETTPGGATGGGGGGPPDGGTTDAGTDAEPDGAAGGAGGTGGACTGPPSPPLVNALVAAGGEVLVVYPAPHATGGVAYRMSGTTVEALDAQGASLWTAEPGEGQLFGGFDFDEDGWPDLGVVQSQPLSQLCGTTPMVETWISFLQGQDGTISSGISPMPDLCWTFGSVTYPTSQWSVQGVLFGPDSDTLTVLPYYAASGWFFRWDGGFSSEYFYYPSTSSYDDSYLADQPNAWGTGTSYLANSHIANGLMLRVGGQHRLAFFTSGRVVQYAVVPFGSAQLLHDAPFVTGGRTDLAGRNYGLVARDPSYADHLVLIAGTDGQALYLDRVAGQPGSDDWGQIERHVTVYDLTTHTVDDRFFSYAHDDNDGHQYEGRVAYPDRPFVHVADGQPSRLAFNVFSAGQWTLHVTEPGTTVDALLLADHYLWDIRDLDGDGTAEWVISPTPNGYLPSWQTDLHQWNEPATSLTLVASHPGVLPARAAGFRQPERTTSRGALYPTLVVAGDCEPLLLTRTEQGELQTQPLP
ncbi:MAG: hypothetical protein JRI68_05250 [Deltaproteobacteria bacterium]|nr:hypothetical protein [Deltaproteobacteria bacterium]